MVSRWSLSDSKSHQASRNLLSNIADQHTALVNMGSILLLISNPISINSFTQCGNNTGIITSTINISIPSPLWENGDQLSENQEENKSLYPNYTLVTQGLLPFFLLQQELQSQRLTCQTTYTIKHVLRECRAFALIRKRFFEVNTLNDLFEKVNPVDVLNFLRETGLYQRIWWMPS